ncbi:MAG: lipocalin-like domain-containing protein [Bacteroidaceae bacterium]|nr:lipocalin-like domain-containing protein [Bacteroidaceae bacterium]MBQ8695802.1 lipocalin-like domain-containing protein [Bacteroidaceae bacterium]
MRKQIYTIMTLFALVLTSCESYLVNGDLDGFWQVKSIEDKQTGDITRCKGDIYYSFQRELVLVSYTSPETPTGQSKENYIAYFTHENDSIYMTDFRIYLDRNGKQAPLSELEKFGLYELYNTFAVEELNRSSLVLSSEKTRISLKKY